MALERRPEHKLRLVCGNCGIKGYFANEEESYLEGWDNLYRNGYNACPDCLGVSVYFPLLHAQQARLAYHRSDAETAEGQLQLWYEQSMKFDNFSVEDAQAEMKAKGIDLDAASREASEKLRPFFDKK